MQHIITIFIMMATGALIGWITNRIAIKLLFRPMLPYAVPMLPFTIQGLLPRRKKEVADSIGKVVEEELISIEEIAGQMITAENQEQISNIIKDKIVVLVKRKFPSFLPSFLKDSMMDIVNETLDQELPQNIAEITDELVQMTSQNINIKEIVEEKINGFPLDKLETIVYQIAAKELTHIEMVGAILGGIIGFTQGMISILLLS